MENDPKDQCFGLHQRVFSKNRWQVWPKSCLHGDWLISNGNLSHDEVPLINFIPFFSKSSLPSIAPLQKGALPFHSHSGYSSLRKHLPNVPVAKRNRVQSWRFMFLLGRRLEGNKDKDGVSVYQVDVKARNWIFRYSMGCCSFLYVQDCFVRSMKVT